MNDESKATTKNKNLSILERIVFFLGMLIFLSFALLMGSQSYKWITMPINFFISDAIIYGLLSLGLGFTAFMLGYVVFMPVARHGWIKNKLFISAILSFLFIIFIPYQLAGYHQHVFRSFDSDANSNLHHMFLACQTYWEEKGSDKNCDLNTVTQKEYGFVQSEYVNIDGKGTAKNFTATAQHLGSPIIFTIDAIGNIRRKQPAP